MAISFIALGSNMRGAHGEPAAAVRHALRLLGTDGMKIIAQSQLYRSPAWPDPRDPEFVNAVARIETNLAPAALLARLHAIEADFGRTRRVANAPRPLDLDIIDYDGTISTAGESPVLPHPRLADRAFVLLPLQEIAPDWRHPVTGLPIARLIQALPDPAAARPIVG
jgi:2-amino-4-hydroxy-6-hydroxymethyldihydropteridine diphosphokinase